MDDSVLQAMAKWPDVPECFGWLRLDARGRWHVPSGVLTHSRMVAFIGRNYTHDTAGRWYFQNGPQRVFVDLDYTPWVYRLRHAGIEDHTGQPVQGLARVYLDDHGAVVLETERGLGVLDDRDLSDLLSAGEPGPELSFVTLLGRRWPLLPIKREQVAMLGHYNPQPRN